MKKLLAALCFVILTCTSAVALEVISVENQAVWYRLHLGIGVDAQGVSSAAALQFIDTQISPRFPDGMTITYADGQWYSPEHGVSRDKTIVVDLLVPDTPEAQAKVAELGKLYITTFAAEQPAFFAVKISQAQTSLYYPGLE